MSKAPYHSFPPNRFNERKMSASKRRVGTMRIAYDLLMDKANRPAFLDMFSRCIVWRTELRIELQPAIIEYFVESDDFNEVEDGIEPPKYVAHFSNIDGVIGFIGWENEE